MYISANIAERIKLEAKRRNVSVKQMLADINLGANTMSNFKTSMPKADSLAKIADYLNCSVDYLLGRTEVKENSSSAEAKELSEDEYEVINGYRSLNDEGKEKVRDYISDIVLGGRYKKDNASGMVQEA